MLYHNVPHRIEPPAIGNLLPFLFQLALVMILNQRMQLLEIHHHPFIEFVKILKVFRFTHENVINIGDLRLYLS
jgi:hypothetical protein